ncbi:hypothetical protein [Leucobacter sp. 1207-22]|uniref:hypothetical protein n=1 Tax=Leucobacter sp. 1207-22 TaxID=2604456 RepID=UPI0040636631
MELTTRELASIIILITFVALAVALSRDRQKLWSSFASVVKAFLAWKVWSVILVLLLHSVAIVLLAAWLGFWTVDLLKDTVLVVFFTGIPLLMASMSKKSGTDLMKYLVKEILGVTAFVVAYINLAPFPLWGELLLQVTVIFLVMCAAVGRLDPKTKPASTACEILLGTAGIGIFLHTTWFVISHFDTFDWAQESLVFTLSVWLPLALVPVVYPISFIAASETAMLRLRFGSGKKEVARRIKLAMVAGFHGRLHFASRFPGDWGAELAKQKTYRGARHLMKEYRAAVRQAAANIRAKRLHTRNMAGMQGLDGDGYWLDRREFKETKDTLTSLYFSQMGFARNHKNCFSEDPLSLLLHSEFEGLPEPHGIEIRTAKDRRTWLAYRKTTGGCYLAIGSKANNLTEKWQYSGVIAPAGFPGSEESGWCAAGTENDRPNEWAKSDRELRDVLAPDELRNLEHNASSH